MLQLYFSFLMVLPLVVFEPDCERRKIIQKSSQHNKTTFSKA